MADARIPPDRATNLYNAACLMARCTGVVSKDDKLPEGKRKELAKDYADRALAHLKESVAKGFSGADLMKKDPDLQPPQERRTSRSY